ncbi:MAG: 2-oxoglutarate dehydrogenase E1 component, partial [Acidobacteria bacterium]|nr:2-oxoglutarate dehydrogenase E1 component [Acidobacteriota bacterium]
VIRPWRKPLVVMTPKSLLRHPDVVSDLDLFTEGAFQRILADTGSAGEAAQRILLCSGKVYFDLASARKERGLEDKVAILRLEQLYPLADEHIAAALAQYKDETPAYWVQEEPENMGAWSYLRFRFLNRLCGRFPFEGVTRAASASPATGSASSHKLEQQQLIDQAFAGLE